MPSAVDASIAAIEGGGPLWFPGLAPTLAARVEAEPGRAWVKDEYGTQRWLANDAAAPCDAVATIVCVEGARGAVVERLAAATRARFDTLTFAEPKPDALARLRDAFALLASLPGLDTLLGALTRAVHVLVAEPGYDVSHSDPALPFSIFVSGPDASERHAIARLAESVLHETLHLQLTLIEGVCPLVAEPRHALHSPWQSRERPLSGVLHGLYVFAGIREVLATLVVHEGGLEGYARRRHREIADDARALPKQPAGLTAVGRRLWARAIEICAV